MDKYDTIFGSVCVAAAAAAIFCFSSCAIKTDATGEARKIKALEAFKVCVSTGHAPAECDLVTRTSFGTN